VEEVESTNPLPGNRTARQGKITWAHQIEAEKRALRLTKDEWMEAFYGPANPPLASDVIKGRLIEIGLRALELGVNVVNDFGLWGKDERTALRQAAADLGAEVEMLYFDLPAAEQRRRLDERQTTKPHTTWPITDAGIAEWTAVFSIPSPCELDGTERIENPPTGFATRTVWRKHRWPLAIP
jgi:predicted kinase